MVPTLSIKSPIHRIGGAGARLLAALACALAGGRLLCGETGCLAPDESGGSNSLLNSLAAGRVPISPPGAGGPERSMAPAIPTREYYDYQTQSGDTLYTVAVRFNAYYSEIMALDGLNLPEKGLLNPGRGLRIPKKFTKTTDSARLFPDSEIVFSQTSAKFNVDGFLAGERGYLFGYADGDGLTGGGIIRKLAQENSINPKILLALLEYTSGWVTNKQPPAATVDYPMRFQDPWSKGLNAQMMLAINYLERGYYGWRDARILCLYFNNGENLRLAPDLNAGTVAVMYYFSKVTSDSTSWRAAVDRFFAVYTGFFGDPWARALEPLYPSELYPPWLILPFPLGQSWCFSNGPHGAWDARGPEAAVDFAPEQYEYSGPETRTILASVSGCVVRSEGNTVVIDLDCDGSENTGWALFYYHLSEQGRIRPNSKVSQGQKIGYASCEGGACSGIHIHMARKFNGEWILAGGAIPLVLSRWVMTAGAEGEWRLVRGGGAVIASKDCKFANIVAR